MHKHMKHKHKYKVANRLLDVYPFYYFTCECGDHFFVHRQYFWEGKR